MTAVYPNEGLPTLLSLLLKDAAVPVVNWLMFLWVNNEVPDQDSVLADFDVATFTGYSDVTITRATWTAPAIVANKAVSTYGTTPTLWTATGAFEDIYGYGIYRPDTSKLLIVERFAALVDLSVTPIIGVLPRVTLTTE